MKLGLAIFLLCALTCVAASGPDDWTQWRGPHRDGVISSFKEPRVWPENLTLKWKIKVGEGHSSPVVSGRYIYLLSREDENEVVRGLDLATGKELWRDSYPVEYTMHSAATAHGKGPKSTPLLADGKLFTFGISGVFSCYDAKTGKLRWRKETAKQFDNVLPSFGLTVSPLFVNGLVITHTGNNQAGALKAFDAETGEEKWNWTGDSPSYASPVIAKLAGARQVILLSLRSIVGIAAESGALLWQIPYPGINHAVTPIVYRDTVIASGTTKGMTAFSITKKAGEWSSAELWHIDNVESRMSSPVLDGSHLFGLSNKQSGQFFCLDAQTGKLLWTSEGRKGEYATVSRTDDKLLLLTNGGALIVAKISKERFEPLKNYQLSDSQTWAHLVIASNQLLVKDKETLALWSLEYHHGGF